MNKKHLFSLSLTLVIVMLFSAMGPTTVYADGESPSDTQPAETTETDGEDETGDTAAEEDVGEGESGDTAAEEDVGEGESGDTAAEEDVGEEPADETSEEQVDETAASEEGTEELPADETTEEVADEGTAEEPSLMEQVPDNTEVVVLNSEGEVEPLATQEAADAVVESDPIWCPGNQAPTPGANGCTDSYSSFDELLTFLKANEGDAAYQTAGTIYVEMGDYGGGESSIDFNDYGFIDFEENDLTIQGGWNTSTGTTSDTSSFDVPFVIGSEANPWGGSLTLNNIIITGVADDTALTVYSDGDVTIEDSEFTQNKDGVFVKAGRNVNVRNTKVNDNGSNDWEIVDGKGLEIKSDGYVTLSDVEANDNQIFGSDIESLEGASIVNSFFNGNLMYTPELVFYGYGLTVDSQGAIALLEVEANENYLWGGSINGPIVNIQDSKFNRNVSDTDIFIDDTGLLVNSTGEVNLLRVEANDNRMVGADIQAGGPISISESEFNRNFGTTVDDDDVETYWGYGLQANTDNGPIALFEVEADDNYLFGANLIANSFVSIDGSSFSRNATPGEQSDWGLNNNPVINIELNLVPQGGLMVQSGENTNMTTTTVNDNGLFGADIQAGGNINISDSVFSNNLDGAGLTANTTSGNINLTDVIIVGNSLDGANLETNCGRVNVTGGQFVGNGGYGIYVTNSLLALNGGPVFTPPNNGAGPTMVVNPGGCIFPSPTPNNSTEAPLPLYTVAAQTESELPATLDQTFVSALQVTLTAQGQAATNLTITLSFPIPAGMEDANLTVMFWNGAEWIVATGGSLMGDQFVITVTQPGIYVLVAQ